MRRKFWSVAAGLIGLLFTQMALAGGNPLRAQYVPGPKLTIINNSGYPANQVYLAFLAIPYGDDPYYHRILWGSEFLATFPRIDPADNTVNVPGANNNPYADYSTTLDRLPTDSKGNHYFYVPQGVAAGDDKGCHGRLWISFKKSMYFHVMTGKDYAQPSISNPNDANFGTVFDFFEPAVTQDGKVHADTTNVDMVSMSMLYELKNNGTSIGIKGFNRSVGELRQAFLNTPVFKSLVTPTRIVCPGQAGYLNPPLAFPADYFNKYVDYCWQHWTENTLTFEYPLGTTWSGKVDADTHKLKLSGTIGGVPEDHYINKPLSRDVFLCNGAFDVDSVRFPPPPPDTRIAIRDRDKAIKNMVASALNRTVMHLPPYPDPANKTEYPWPYAKALAPGAAEYYQQNGLTMENYKTNVYSKLLHELSYDGTIYGFAYDDNNRQASYIDGLATDIILTINQCQSVIAPELYLLLLEQ